jgi:uncharacterized Rmd1/YagE family protein
MVHVLSMIQSLKVKKKEQKKHFILMSYCTCVTYILYRWVQYKTNQHKKLNPEKNIYFQDTPSIPLEFAH